MGAMNKSKGDDTVFWKEGVGVSFSASGKVFDAMDDVFKYFQLESGSMSEGNDTASPYEEVALGSSFASLDFLPRNSIRAGRKAANLMFLDWFRNLHWKCLHDRNRMSEPCLS